MIDIRDKGSWQTNVITHPSTHNVHRGQLDASSWAGYHDPWLCARIWCWNSWCLSANNFTTSAILCREITTWDCSAVYVWGKVDHKVTLSFAKTEVLGQTSHLTGKRRFVLHFWAILHDVLVRCLWSTAAINYTVTYDICLRCFKQNIKSFGFILKS